MGAVILDDDEVRVLLAPGARPHDRQVSSLQAKPEFDLGPAVDDVGRVALRSRVQPVLLVERLPEALVANTLLEEPETIA